MAAAAIGAYLTQVLNFTDPERDAVIAQGINDFDTLRAMRQSDFSEIASAIRRGPPPAAFPHTRIVMLEKLWFATTFQFIIQQDLTAGQYQTVYIQARLNELFQLKQTIDRAKKTDTPPLPEKFKVFSKFRQTIESIEAYLEQVRGADGTFLIYLTRENDAPTPLVPAVGNNASVFPPGWSFDQAMVERHPMTGAIYQEDNQTLWSVVYEVFHGTSGWAWVKSFHRAKDGRGAYFALQRHFLDDATMSRIQREAELVVDTTYYKGDTRNFDFESFVSRLQDAHLELEAIQKPMDERSKINKLLDALQDPKLEPSKMAIIAQPATFPTFESCVNFLGFRGRDNKSFSGNTRKISAITQKGSERQSAKKAKVNKNFKPQDRFYPASEWKSMSAENRAKLIEFRDKLKSKKTNTTISELKINELVATVDKLKKTIDSKSTASTADESDSEDSEALGAKMNRKAKVKGSKK